MTTQRRWRDTGHLERAIDAAAGPEGFEEGVEHLQDRARGWPLAELRKHRGLSQKQVAEQMGVSVVRVSQIEQGEVSTRDVLDRYVSALGGVLKLVADFGDEQLRVG
ncbi:helix-turn-helix domain-containing protein [Nocardia sp. NPDC052316]|uniref:helix-turn-helix domain-containing protein n=1 Tax=Nocardia sp. NPDC052316 TaxID=3364329 RepID=UPI0037C7948F